MSKIVVGIDGSEYSLRALAWAAQEAKIRGSTLHLVHSWKFPPPVPFAPGEYPHIDIEGAANKILDDAIATLDPDTTFEREIANETPGQALVRASEGAELIVVGARGMGGFKGLLLGSVSQQVAHHAKCPVVIVPHNRPD